MSSKAVVSSKPVNTASKFSSKMVAFLDIWSAEPVVSAKTVSAEPVFCFFVMLKKTESIQIHLRSPTPESAVQRVTISLNPARGKEGRREATNRIL